PAPRADSTQPFLYSSWIGKIVAVKPPGPISIRLEHIRGLDTQSRQIGFMTVHGRIEDPNTFFGSSLNHRRCDERACKCHQALHRGGSVSVSDWKTEAEEVPLPQASA